MRAKAIMISSVGRGHRGRTVEREREREREEKWGGREGGRGG
jgi:hypothetical protein